MRKRPSPTRLIIPGKLMHRHASTLRRHFFWLLLPALLFSARLPAATEVNPIGVEEALRDNAGGVWGIDRARHGLVLLDGQGQWQPAMPSGLAPGMQPVCLVYHPGHGTVICLWKTDDTHYQYSEQVNQDSRALTPFSLPGGQFVRRIRLTGDSKGNLWLTLTGPDIYRIKSSGAAERLHHLSADECLPGSFEDGKPADVWGLVSMCEDADGHGWFWTDHAYSGGAGGAIRGVLRYDGANFVQHDLLPPGEHDQKRLIMLTQKDEQHLWFVPAGGGLCTIDIANPHTEQVAAPPDEGSFTSFAEQNSSGDWLFITAQPGTKSACTLWRLTDGRHWDKLIDGVDALFEPDNQRDRLWVQGEHGNYLGSNGKGVWFLPVDGSTPRQLDSRQAFSLASPHRLLNLSDGRWLGVGADGRTRTESLAALLPESGPPVKLKYQTMSIQTPFRADLRGHLWTTLTDNATNLYEWNGDRWIEHPFPSEFAAEGYVIWYNLDARGRVWLNARGDGSQTAVYDPWTSSWQRFENLKQAVEAQGGRHDAELVPADSPCRLPRFGPGGRICYLDGGFQFTYFDGHQWQQWNESQIKGQQQGSYGGPPFFDRAGHASINIGKHTMEYVDDVGWQVTDFEPGFAEWSQFLMGANRTPPPEFKLPFQSEQSTIDNQGTWWLLHDHTLYKARDGLCVPVFGSSTAQPFADGRSLGWAFVDPKGHAFLRSDNNVARNITAQVVTLASPGPPPQTTLAQGGVFRESATNVPADRIIIRLSTDAKPIEGKARFSWRLDGGPWTPLAVDGSGSDLILDGLPGGPHHIEARSFDPSLQTDITPAVFGFEVHVDPQAQIAGYIAQLSDPDYARRNAAVAALAHQPALALPALQQARAQADEARRWWIDAAQQRIERTKQAGTGNPRETPASDRK